MTRLRGAAAAAAAATNANSNLGDLERQETPPPSQQSQAQTQDPSRQQGPCHHRGSHHAPHPHRQGQPLDHAQSVPSSSTTADTDTSTSTNPARDHDQKLQVAAGPVTTVPTTTSRLLSVPAPSSALLSLPAPRPPNSTDTGLDAVTPGIQPSTYRLQQYDPPHPRSRLYGLLHLGSDNDSAPDYFSQAGAHTARSSFDTDTTDHLLHYVDFQLPSGLAVPDPAAAMGRRESLSEIRAANPDLSLSGNIISATFNIPHAFTYRKSGNWELKSRRGQSALFDSFSYLSSDATPWSHTVVAWTGEIDIATDAPLSPPKTPDATTVGASSLNPLSAPVPVDAAARLPTPPPADGLWVSKEDQTRLEQQLCSNQAIRTIPVWLADESDTTDSGITLGDQARWRRYAEHDLYTLFHYKQHEPSDGRSERVQWADYYRMNQAFASKIIDAYQPGDIVVVHDYYLMLLPSMLRQKVPNMYISFYLHAPFPSSEFLRCLPRRKEVLEGILGANLIGFQSYSYSRHFLSCCTRILGFPSDTLGIDAYGTRVQVGVFPIGIDAARVESFAWAGDVNQKYATLKEMYKGKKIIVGRDRLDSVRGVAQKLQAFERFLEMYPEWRERVVLIQVTSPTSVESEKEDPENKIATRVNELVMKINGQYGSLGFSPVQHYPQYLTQDEYFALLRAGDIGLITSVRDGMNTTSLEYIICQKESNGPLILSEFSGTAGSLSDAIHINPWDLTGVADKINNALTMSEEKRLGMQSSLYRHVTTHTVQSWIDKFVHMVVTVLGDSSSANATPLLDRSLLLGRYRAARKRLFMFDYDGTLTPIVREPSAAIPSERLLQSLRILCSDPKNAVWIISGRDQDFLNQHLGGISQLGFSAEHGSFMRHPGSDVWENLAEKFDMGWQVEVMKVFESYTDRTPGSFIERKRCALTWHYRLADPEQGLHMSQECRKELENTVGKNWEVDVMPGKANIEVRPTFINKGEISKRLVEMYNNNGDGIEGGLPGKVEFSLCMGDDFTDEDMFRALNGLAGPVLDADHVFTVTVGASTKVTLARWHLLEAEDVVDCVTLLAGAQGAAEYDRLGEVNLAALSMVEGHIPDNEK